MLRFMLQCHEVATRIMSCFAIGLGLPEDYFVDLMDPQHDDCGTVSISFCRAHPQRDRKLHPNDEHVDGSCLVHTSSLLLTGKISRFCMPAEDAFVLLTDMPCADQSFKPCTESDGWGTAVRTCEAQACSASRNARLSTVDSPGLPIVKGRS